jgi:hypothetical protein
MMQDIARALPDPKMLLALAPRRGAVDFTQARSQRAGDNRLL